MHILDLKKTQTRWTILQGRKLIRAMARGGLILSAVSFLSLSGPSLAYAHTACQQSQSIEDTKYTEFDAETIARAVWGEARGCSRDEQKLVVWCICNRADVYDMSLYDVVTAKNQFTGYSRKHPVDEDILEVVYEVLEDWERGERALVLEPYATDSMYLYFNGRDGHNWFRYEY